MFHSEGVNALYTKHRDMLEKLVGIQRRLGERFHDMEPAIDALLVAAMSGEALLLIGPPGTAKSLLIRSFCHLIGLIEERDLTGGTDDQDKGEIAAHPDYFEYLLTQFTEPSELFGFYDIGALMGDEHKVVRNDENMMQNAKVVFLDEVFNASSAILNSLLTFMNERKFHDRGKSVPTPLKLLVGATNFPPKDDALGAIYDRFLVRVWVNNMATRSVPKNDLDALLRAGWDETHSANLDREDDWPDLLDEIVAFQEDIDDLSSKGGSLAINSDDPLLNDLAELIGNMVKAELSQMSNRRIIKLAGVALCHCLLRCAKENEDSARITADDLSVFLKYSLDRPDENAEEIFLSKLCDADART